MLPRSQQCTRRVLEDYSTEKELREMRDRNYSPMTSCTAQVNIKQTQPTTGASKRGAVGEHSLLQERAFQNKATPSTGQG